MNSPNWDTSTGLDDEERRILKEVCDEVGIPSSVVERMIDEEQKVYGMGRRHGIQDVLETLILEGINTMERDQ
ncbi:MAG: hypothetical protein NTU79_00915 [Planctomycetota bacterium]|nr:hypothetical protein [Planctomycetota bacterium]